MKRILDSIWIEILIIVLGAILFCLPALNFSSNRVLAGSEFILLIQTHYIWKLLPECGTCIFWNGLFNGGAPTFAEIHNAPAHPFVFIPAIFLGAINGSKITFLLSYITAGIGQWRLSKSIGLGRVFRIWTAFIMMYAGGISGKMETGNVGLVLSVSCCILFISELYNFIFNPVQSSSYIKIAISFSLCVLAGQGYYQLAVVGLLLPVAMVFAYQNHGKTAFTVMLKGLSLSFLLCGFFLIPILHFLPNTYKDIDLEMLNLQPLGYSILNLVIKDIDFFYNTSLGKQMLPYTYYQYIGWIPVILAVYGLTLGGKNKQLLKPILWFSVSIVVILMFFSQEIMLPLSVKIPALAAMRFASISITLIVPFVLALAGIGLENFSKLSFGNFYWLSQDESGKLNIPIIYPVLIIIMLVSVYDNFNSNRGFVRSLEMDRPGADITNQYISDTVRWIEPFNSALFPLLLANNEKMSYVFRPWHWIEHPEPVPELCGQHHPDIADPEATYRIGEFDYYVDESQKYAAIYGKSDVLFKNCVASTSGGGLIEVECGGIDEDNDTLIVQENYFSGWKAWIDGKKTDIDRFSRFITIRDMPTGDHTIVLKYQPWDVWMGIFMSISGAGICVWELFGKRYVKNKNEIEEVLLDS